MRPAKCAVGVPVDEQRNAHAAERRELALATAFTNTGTVNVASGATLDLTRGTFANVVGGSLNGGTYGIGGTLLYSGADITAIGPHDESDARRLGQHRERRRRESRRPDQFTRHEQWHDHPAGSRDSRAYPGVHEQRQPERSGDRDTRSYGRWIQQRDRRRAERGAYTIGGTLRYSGADITAIGATASLALDGNGSIVNANGGNHDALVNSLATNNGTLTLQNHADLALTQAFTNNGNLNVAATAKLDLTGGGFHNVNSDGLLSGGTYNIGGTLIYNGQAIQTIDRTGQPTLDGGGSIVNGSNQNQLTGSLTTNNGTLTVQNGANLALTQAFTNNGNLNVMANAKLDLTGGGFANVNAGVLSGGTYTIGGTLIYNGQAIQTIDRTASLTLAGNGRIVSGSNQDQLTGRLLRSMASSPCRAPL